ncbi:hypothetical protein PSTT_05062 [Puccinia striiformis]|uniref:Uncharacterized protein n=1 Tax=Puccinia striiformis TaxID=27350 RepID=A0A2S4VQG6_9BASI|nr:hypothetical protein PSTT_05062 [Puccinia striiformis]
MAIESQTQQPDQGNETDQSQTQNRRSRQASSIVTAPNMVAAPLDSRVSMSGQPVVKACKRPAEPSSEQESVASVGSVKSKGKSKGKSKNKKKSQSKKGKKQKSTSGAAESKKKKDEYAHPTEYFHDGVWEEGDELGTALNFKCKWCHETYRGQKLSNGNLKTHRDGSTQAHKNPNGCVNREHAKRSGILLPPSVAETRALEAKDQGDNTQKLLPFKPAFVNRVLNQLVMLWQIRQALPWTRIKDPFLCAAFPVANLKAVLYGGDGLRMSRKSYINLDTKFTLIHDVWTTKGNRFAFIGAAVAYIDQQWEYVTTDSGSNNNTMASAMYELIHGGNTSETADELEWDPTTMHVRCICHKFALIVNAGLAALDLKTLPPAKAKESVLGFFPVLGRLTEVEEPIPRCLPLIQIKEINADNEGLDVGAESDGGYSDSHTSEIVKVNSSDGKHVRSSKLLALTTKVFVELTSQMEGNSATGAHVIPKYLELKESLTAKLLQAQMQDSLYPMYHAMLNELNGISTKPCAATPCLLDREFQRVKQTQQQPTDPDPDITVIKRPPAWYPLLSWNGWPLANHLLYPTLQFWLARILQCLGAPALWSVILSRFDVCSSRRGSLLPSTMSHCVSSLMWLREDVLLDGDFEEAGKALKGLIPTKK